MSNIALAIGIATTNKNNEIIDVFFPEPIINPTNALNKIATQYSNIANDNKILAKLTDDQLQQLLLIFKQHNYQTSTDFIQTILGMNNLGSNLAKHTRLIITSLQTDEISQNIAQAHLKLQMISRRMFKPHELNLDNIFKILPNIAWTNQGAIDPTELNERQLKSRINNQTLIVYSVDKFPRMTEYFVPHGVRIADTSRIRLGAYLGEGTTVMHEGFVNFNAGTLGASMVEGRISAGVIVGKGSDIGGGASIMGTLSGGGNIRVSIGEQSLLGANAGLGFPLGDRCIVESGLYVTAGSKVTLLDRSGNEINIVKASELSGVSDLLFRRNSQTGRIECLPNKNEVELNNDLHTNN